MSSRRGRGTTGDGGGMSVRPAVALEQGYFTMMNFRMTRSVGAVALGCAVALGGLSLGGCSTAPRSESDRAEIRDKAQQTLARAQQNDPTLTPLLGSARGYAVFPTVGKGAVGVGGAYGRGVLYQNGVQVGYCDLSQGSIGFQLGGQAYSEIIVFQTDEALNRFKSGNFAFAAQATAVALRSGAGANAKFEEGVAVFTMNEAGLMYEASIGGQNFDYQPF